MQILGGVLILRFVMTEIDTENIIVELCKDHHTYYHSHNFIELLYVVKGQATHNLNGDITTISKGDYLLVDYGSKHQYIQQGDEPLQILNCLFIPRLFDETLNTRHRFDEIADNNAISVNFRSLKGHPAKFIYHDSDGHIGKTLLYLLKEYNEKAMGYQEILRCQLIYILIDSMRQIQLPGPEEIEHDVVKHITKYVDKHFTEKITLEQFSEKYGYCLSHISRKFKSETGLTFREYLQSVRINKSCNLLTTTSKKVTEIAEMVGYSDLKHFNEVFKRQTGLTPMQFRKATK